jgi:hypothetical protein
MGVAPVVVLQRISPTALQSLFWTHGRQLGNVQIVNNNVAPRLSVAWDPWGDGKTKLALTAGRYYDKIFLAVPLVELEPITTTMELEAILSRATGEWVVEDIRSGINPAVNTQVVDRALRTPYQTEYTVAVERELWPETSLKATYVHRSFQNQLQNVDLNHYAYDYGRCNPEPAVGRPPLIPRPDGVLDDCVGQLASPFMNIGNVQLPDGYLDTYVYNPGWGTIYEVGNYNTADYRALVLEFVRRQYRNWQMVASYTYSRAVGDAEDFNSFLGDDRTTLEAERGYLSYDQRHVAKINTTVVAPWSLRLGLTASWQTGLPYSLLRQAPTWDSVPPQYEGLGTPDPRVRVRYVTRQRNDQRNLSIWNFNVRVDKQFSFSRRGTIEIAAELFNLLNERTYTIFNPFLGYGAQINGNNEAYVRTGRQLQISFRATF